MPRYSLGGPGLLVRGNIDIDARALVKVPVGDGRFASIKSVSWHLNPDQLVRYKLNRPQGAEVLVPTVIRRGNKWAIVTDRGALNHYYRTGRHLGIFDTPAHATAYANRLHLQQQRAGASR